MFYRSFGCGQLIQLIQLDQYINIPLDKVRAEASNHFNGSDTIIVYCLDYKCHASTKAAKILQQLGYFNVFDFKEGKKEWVDAGLDLEK